MRFFRGHLLLTISLLLVPMPGALEAQTRSNYASSITSESMASVWIAKELRPVQKIWPRSSVYIDAPLALGGGRADGRRNRYGSDWARALGKCRRGRSRRDGVANLVQKLDYRLNTRAEIKRKEDLREKRIAVSGPGSTSHLVALLALQNLALDPNQAKITFLTIPGTEINRRLALESGTVEATTLNGSVGDTYGQKGYPVLFNFKGSGVTMPQTMLVTTRRVAANKPQVVDAYIKAIVEAIAYMLDPTNKETVTRAMAVNLRLSNASEADEAYKAVIGVYRKTSLPDC